MKIQVKSAATLAVACGLSLMVIPTGQAYANEISSPTPEDNSLEQNGTSASTVNAVNAQRELNQAQGNVDSAQTKVDVAEKALANHESSSDIQKQINELNKTISEDKAAIETAENEINAVQNEIIAQNNNMADAENGIAALNEKLNQAQADKSADAEKNNALIAEAQEKSNKLADDVKYHEGRVKRSEESLNIATNLLNEETQKRDRALAERENLTDAGDIADLEYKIEKLNNNIDIYNEEVEEAKEDLAAKKDRLNEAITQRDSAKAELDELLAKQAALKDIDLIVKHENQLVGNVLKNDDFADNFKITFTKNGNSADAVRMKNTYQTTPNVVNFYVNKTTGGLYFQLGSASKYDGSRVDITCEGYKPLSYEFQHLGGYRWTLLETDAKDPLQEKIDDVKKSLPKKENDVQFAEGKVERSENFLSAAQNTLRNEEDKKALLETKKQALEDKDAEIQKLNQYVESREEVVEQSKADVKSRRKRSLDTNDMKQQADNAVLNLIALRDTNQADHDNKIASLQDKLEAAQRKLDGIVLSIADLQVKVQDAMDALALAQAKYATDTSTKSDMEAKLNIAKQLEANLKAAQEDLKTATVNRDRAAVALAVAKTNVKSTNEEPSKPVISQAKVERKMSQPAEQTTPQTTDFTLLTAISTALAAGIGGFALTKKYKK